MISMDKKYRYRNGSPARILCVDGVNISFPVISMDSRGIPFAHEGNGKVCRISNIDEPYDLIEVSLWDDFKIDEPVMVRDRGDIRWNRRYFAGVGAEGVPQAWLDGATSWSAYDRNPLPWDECRRPTPEEMEGKS